MASRSTSHRFLRYAATASAVTVVGSVALYNFRSRRPLEIDYSIVPSFLANPPRFPKITPRNEQIAALKKSSSANPDAVYDLLVIGGGATGTGIALDAATRGFKVALVERDDFSSGTSSKSTKLVHGGVRYLEKAVKDLDYEQYKLVCTALKERRYFLDIAPHLSQSLPMLLPIKHWWEAPYLWIGTQLYDLLAGSEGLHSSYFMPRGKAIQEFPTLDASRIVGGLIYYDGQHNDSRMNVSLAMTAAVYGATVANHMEVTALEKDADGIICGVKVKDCLSDDEEFLVKARGVINATGPFADSILQKDQPSMKEIIMPSSGVHIVLPDWVGPKSLGLIDPSSDGRVIFLLPWQGKMVAGTTDQACKIEQEPIPEEEEVNWIVGEVNRLLAPGVTLKRSDVLATWSGIRPLVRDPTAKNTESLTRSHLITVSDSGLLTCVGGKWTTYREMAEDAVDTAIKAFGLRPQGLGSVPHVGGFEATAEKILDGSCQTQHLRVIGAHGYSPKLRDDLLQRFELTSDVADHLAHSYGDRAWEVASLSSSSNLTQRIAGDDLPFVDGEVRYAIRNEYAMTAADIIGRRMRLAFIDVQAALKALPTVISIMGDELRWNEKRKQQEFKEGVRFLRSMGLREEVAV
ncbi:glycerol-3-phosphate dehydrogenase [Talaromyces proteolyticus]|uniref:Glycerol-3-phosphate dehydrogenase n=1 Tax=Talaromyces proteolyticus TaxID=1131652 RepID=A0AAD4KMD6_9EURO|nr:glycerol-3-phosphate dehydrogenase [Talaromyces proteolyticus]KAH8694296.1 glycerol-3-phosphate dehydrogenase [Talaromyces proteolyticus]